MNIQKHMAKKQAGSVHKLTANIKTWSSQHFSIASVANQVVSWLLQGAIELMKCDTGFGRAKDLIRVSSQAFSIQLPVQGSSCYFQLGANGAHRSQARADLKHWILGGYDSQVWGSEEEETSWFKQFYSWIYDCSGKGRTRSFFSNLSGFPSCKYSSCVSAELIFIHV